MTLTNVSKPATSIANTTQRVVSYETWDTNPNTWDGETRTWDGCASNWTNTSKSTTSITNTSKPA